MCRAVTCAVCGRTTWAGCGQHVDQVRRTVPAGQWCPGHTGTAATAAAPAGRGGLFSRLLGR